MTAYTTFKSNLDYGRDLVRSGLQGARSMREILEGVSVGSVLGRSAREALMPAAIGAYVGALGASFGSRRKPAPGLVLAFSLLGATVGFVTGVAWDTRHLTGNMAKGAKKSIDATRDAHWLSKHPIDYA